MMRTATLIAPLALLLGLTSLPALAQNTAQNAPARTTGAPEQLSNQEQTNSRRTEQLTERLHTEDAGSRVDEVRIGGQTQRITVQPKVGDMPAYEVQPTDGLRNRSRSGAQEADGARMWNVIKF